MARARRRPPSIAPTRRSMPPSAPAATACTWRRRCSPDRIVGTALVSCALLPAGWFGHAAAGRGAQWAGAAVDAVGRGADRHQRPDGPLRRNTAHDLRVLPDAVRRPDAGRGGGPAARMAAAAAAGAVVVRRRRGGLRRGPVALAPQHLAGWPGAGDIAG